MHHRFANIEFTLSEETCPEKLQTDKEKEEWAAKVNKAPAIKGSLDDLASYLLKKHSFSHAVCDGWLDQKNFQKSDLLVADIDNKRGGDFTPSKALDRCLEFGIPTPNLIYSTFSDVTPLDISQEEKLKGIKRYRMIWVLEKPVTSSQVFKDLLYSGLYKLIPECDRCGVPQKWYGAKEIISQHENSVLIPIHLIEAGMTYREGKSLQKTKQGRQKGYKEEMKPISNETLYPNVGKVESKKAKIRRVSWEETLCQHSQLFHDFYYCERKIWHNELRGILSSCLRIQGGYMLWRQRVLDNDYISDEKLSIADWVVAYEARGNTYVEEKICNYAPDDIAADKFERLTDIFFRRGQNAELIQEAPLITLDEAERKLENHLKQALSVKKKATFCIKAETGLGKSRLLRQINPENVVIAFPTHKLATEFAAEWKKVGGDFNTMPALPELPESIQVIYDKYQSIGAHVSAARFVKRLAIHVDPEQYGLTYKTAYKLKKSLEDYFRAIDSCLNSHKPIITTHRRVTVTEFPLHDTIIYDEDPFSNFFEYGKVNAKQLRLLKGMNSVKEILDDESLNDLILKIQEQEDAFQKVMKADDLIRFELRERALDWFIRTKRVPTDGKLITLFNSDYVYVDLADHRDPEGERAIHFMKKHDVPQGKKIIILSATLNKMICSRVFDNIEWLEVPQAKHKGTLHQVSDLSLSRSSIASKYSEKVLKFVNDSFPCPVLTFQKYRCLFNRPMDIYFGNCSGYDHHSGDNMVVAGTQHLPSQVYFLTAAALGINFTKDHTTLQKRWVKQNYYRFKFNTFQHDGLREVQFYFVESELVQAVGRSRTLRKDATVTLFSNYPLPQFQQFSFEEIKTVYAKKEKLRVVWRGNYKGHDHAEFSYGEVSGYCLAAVSGSVA